MNHNMKYVCSECQSFAVDGLFRNDKGKMVCCECKYGKPMRPLNWWPVSKLNERPVMDLEAYDGRRSGM